MYSEKMYVVKRDGRQEKVMFDKITARINRLAYDLDARYVDTVLIAQKVRGPDPAAPAALFPRQN